MLPNVAARQAPDFNPFLSGWGVPEAARRAMEGSPNVLMSFGVAAADRARSAGVLPANRIAAQVALRSEAIGPAPDRIEVRSYGGQEPVAYAVKGGSAVSLNAASVALAASHGADLDLETGYRA